MNERTAPRWEPHSLIWAAAILAGSAAFFLIVARPQTARARELRQTVRKERAEMAARFQLLEVLARIEKDVAALTAQTADFDQRIPGTPMLGGVLEELARMAQKEGLRLDTMEPGEPVRTGEVSALPISIEARGPFSGAHALLREIERMPRLTRIDRFASVADEEHPGHVTVTLDLRIFCQASERGPWPGSTDAASDRETKSADSGSNAWEPPRHPQEVGHGTDADAGLTTSRRGPLARAGTA